MRIIETKCNPGKVFLYGGTPAIYFRCPFCGKQFLNYDADEHMYVNVTIPFAAKYWEAYITKFAKANNKQVVDF